MQFGNRLRHTYEYDFTCAICSGDRTPDESVHDIISKLFAVCMLTAERT